MTSADSRWAKLHPFAHKVHELGRQHAEMEALSRVQFFDMFKLDWTDSRDGYSAGSLYGLYLQARTLERVESRYGTF